MKSIFSRKKNSKRKMFIVPIFLLLPFFAFKRAFDTRLLFLLSVTSPLGFKMLKITCILARAFVAVSVKTLERCEIYFEHFAKMNTDFFHRCSLRLFCFCFVFVSGSLMKNWLVEFHSGLFICRCTAL